MAKSEIIGWLNSDDVYIDRGVVRVVVEAFKKNRDIDMGMGCLSEKTIPFCSFNATRVSVSLPISYFHTENDIIEMTEHINKF